MPAVKEYLCYTAIKLIHIWLTVERIIIRLFLKSQIETKIRELCCLDGVNKDLIIVNDSEFYVHAANKSLLGFCESYMNNWISIRNVDKAVANIMKVGKCKEAPGFKYKAFLEYLEFELFFVPPSTKSTAEENSHYNVGNDVFEAMLGPDLIYSCALWLKSTDTLTIAQRNKMTLLAKKMKLKEGMRVLDIGCGWGGMAKFLAEEYGVSVVAMTSSVEGAKYASTLCKGLPVEVMLSDCRDLIENKEKFDRILAMEVLEHVGKKNYHNFFSNVHQCLKDDGIFVIHVQGTNDPRLPAMNSLYSAMAPDLRLPYIKDIIEDTEGLFIIEDWSNIGVNYDRTCLAWNENFKKVRENVKENNGEKFCRMWEFFYQTHAALARTRNIHVWHVVFSKNGIPGGYQQK